MPGHSRPGRRAPVRGDTSLRGARATASEAGRVGQAGGIHHHHHHHHREGYFPPSPPSTIGGGGDEDDDDDDDDDDREGSEYNSDSYSSYSYSHSPSSSSSHAASLTHAAAAIALTRSSRPPEQINNNPRLPPPPATLRPHSMPDTPQQTPTTMSPACASVAHHPTETEQRFLRSILPDFPLQKGAEFVVGSTEDAGLDLVCKGWQGAVLDQSRIHHHHDHDDGDGTSTSHRALYAMMPPHAKAEGLREDVLAVLDVATEQLRCDAVIIALRRSDMDDADWKAILHGLCYVGGSVVATGGAGGRAGQDRLTNCAVDAGVVLVAVDV